MNLCLEWGRVCHLPAQMQQRLQRLLQWLPWSTSQALIREIHGATATTPLPTPPTLAATRVAGKRTRPRSDSDLKRASTAESAAAAAAAMLKGDANAEAALVLLSFLLFPAVECAGGGPEAQGSALQRLEIATSLLLRGGRRTGPAVAAAVGQTECASLWAAVQAQTVATSFHTWVRLFRSFFLEQLREERSRVASLRATVSHPQCTRPTPAARQNASPEEQEDSASPQRSREVALLRAHPLLRRGHLLHALAQKLSDAVRRALVGLEAGSTFTEGDGGARTRCAALQARGSGIHRQKAPRTKHVTRISRQPLPQRRPRRRRRASSSDSASSARSELFKVSADSSNEDSENDVKLSTTAVTATACWGSDVEDGDVPLAALAPLLSRDM